MGISISDLFPNSVRPYVRPTANPVTLYLWPFLLFILFLYLLIVKNPFENNFSLVYFSMISHKYSTRIIKSLLLFFFSNILFFQRFYLNNSVMDYHPKEILVTAVYLGNAIILWCGSISITLHCLSLYCPFLPTQSGSWHTVHICTGHCDLVST